MELSLGTQAAYYQYGLEVGIVSEQEIREWAFSIIEALTDPPFEVIDIATSHGFSKLHEGLSNIPGERNVQLAGRMLLGALKYNLEKFPRLIREIVRKAMQIARSTYQPDYVYYRFDQIDDEIYLVVNDSYGTIEDCLNQLCIELQPYEPLIVVHLNK